MKCSFCNLFTTTHHQSGTFQEYAQTLVREARLTAQALRSEQLMVDSVYFGGGTPSLLSADALGMIMRELRALFPFNVDAELAIEATPDAVDEAKLHDLRRIGFSRISFGVQTFDAIELRAMGRTYDPGLSRRATAAAIGAGFPNVNVDLIYGLPGQTDRTWRTNLEVAVGLGAPTITIYPLTLRVKTQLGHQHHATPASFDLGESTYQRYDAARDFLAEHDYHQYSMAGFATGGGGSRHECNEFKGTPTVGLGAAALSYAPGIHYTSGDYLDTRSPTGIITDYMQAVDSGKLPIRTGIVLNADEKQRRHIIMHLLHDGVDREVFQQRFGEPMEYRFSTELAILTQEDCLRDQDGRLALSQGGRRFSSLVADLFASASVRRLAGAYR
jgi:oxygen-independent coproporphyrinogen-3 oxidase